MFSSKLFGGASIEGADGPLTGRVAQRRRLGLLALLAASPERGLSRDKLVAYLWPEHDSERARHALSDSVYHLNKVLGGDAVLTIGSELRLNPAVLACDVREFREAIETEAWEAAVRVYAGPFLDGFHLPDAIEFERWAETERGRLAAQYAGALEALARQRAASRDLTGAVSAWSRLADHDPYSSRYAIALMGALAAAGNRAGALRHARLHAQMLKQEFGTEADAEVVALAERLRAEPAAVAREATPPDSDAPAAATPPRDEASAATDVGGDPGDAAESQRSPGSDDPVTSPVVASVSPGPSSSGRYRRARDRALVVGAVLVVMIIAAWTLWPRLEPTVAAPTSRARIAVLPFDNLSANEENRYFADGITEDILTNLAGIPDLVVVSSPPAPAGTDPPKAIAEIARELGVDYVLRGSVRRADEQVRITAQLVDARVNAHVWAETYDHRLEDIFAVQSEIAKRVAAELDAEIASGVEERIERAPTEDVVAYNLYLRGRYYWHRRTEADLRESVRFFERAVARDSGFARAWAGLADAYAVLAFYDYLPPATAYPDAKQAADRALAIDPLLAEAHASLGYIALYYDWDWVKAEASFQRSIELNPSYSIAHQWYGNHLMAMGRFDEAAREMSRAREVNPLSLIANGALALVYFYAGRFSDAVQQSELALEMDADWDLGHLWRGQAYEELGRTDDAIASLRRATELSGRSGISVAALAHAYATAGAREPALELLAELVDFGGYRPAFEIAKVHLALGDPDQAVEWLERAYEEHAHSMAFLRVDPQLDALHSHPRFIRLLERVGLD
jgi:TolB-like protein/DNA-binding SARP family transcriptional activator/Tfp pilus assembly protein PilF